MPTPRRLVSRAIAAAALAGCGTLVSVDDPNAQETANAANGEGVTVGAGGDGGAPAPGAFGTVGVGVGGDPVDAGKEPGDPPEDLPPILDASTCTPNAKAAACGVACDVSRPNGCGGTHRCDCAVGTYCEANVCCTPTPADVACAAAGACGGAVIENNCGPPITCGDVCAGTKVCFQKACCEPEPRAKTCEVKGDGTQVNNCGQTVLCGASCVPTDCTGRCGAGLSDDCGGKIDCPPCCPPTAELPAPICPIEGAQ